MPGGEVEGKISSWLCYGECPASRTLPLSCTLRGWHGEAKSCQMTELRG